MQCAKCGGDVRVQTRSEAVKMAFGTFLVGSCCMFLGGVLFFFIVGIPLLIFGVLIVLISPIIAFSGGMRKCEECGKSWHKRKDKKRLKEGNQDG